MNQGTTANKVTTLTVTEYYLSAEDIVQRFFPELEGSDFEVVFEVPKGGDYSGLELAITENRPLIVRVKTKTIELQSRA